MKVSYDMLMDAAKQYADRRARREHCEVRVYARAGIVFVRPVSEPQPDESEIIYTTNGRED